MKHLLAAAALLACAACSQQDAPADEIVETAEELVTASPSPAPLAKGRFAPRDTCAEVEGANAFRAQLARAVAERDANLLADMAASDIKLDFGGGTGPAELTERLGDESWKLWSELDQLMDMGCAANGQGGITIPWFFEQDLGRIDPAYGMLVIGEDVPVKESPGGEGRNLAAISWDLVRIASLQPEEAYQRVELADGTAGFIETAKLRSVIDYRLIASSRNGRWRITSLVAGD
jgi:hypothetical protein